MNYGRKLLNLRKYGLIVFLKTRLSLIIYALIYFIIGTWLKIIIKIFNLIYFS